MTWRLSFSLVLKITEATLSRSKPLSTCLSYSWNMNTSLSFFFMYFLQPFTFTLRYNLSFLPMFLQSMLKDWCPDKLNINELPVETVLHIVTSFLQYYWNSLLMDSFFPQLIILGYWIFIHATRVSKAVPVKVLGKRHINSFLFFPLQ